MNKKRGNAHHKWRGGRIKQEGYILIYLYPSDFFYPMVHNQNYVYEHRLIMARYLGRCLKSSEEVHHLNGIKDDNRIENLAMVDKRQHERKTFIKLLQERIRELEQLHLVL